MNSTSYYAMFTQQAPDAPVIDRIEIPIIQRDYAQGRKGNAVERIRTSFLDVLHDALTGGSPVSLDFVYGDVDKGLFRPLDGQQRLTTLFLLHWYLAPNITVGDGWTKFSYQTRASARLFCERLIGCKRPDVVVGKLLSEWIVDQPWYLYSWRNDPTIQSMLVMLDAMHKRFQPDGRRGAWDRLIDPLNPAISFHLLPMQQMGLSEDLYIKMNSRGKPLTSFENFKARFEQVLVVSCPNQLDEFARKVDVEWADILWPYKGADNSVDDEFLHYFRFVTEIIDWSEGGLGIGDDLIIAERVYGQNPNATVNVDFLGKAFDTWKNRNIQQLFEDLFAVNSTSDLSKAVLYSQSDNMDVNLFKACCKSYGQIRGRSSNRDFSWPHTILLYAVILHIIGNSDDFSRRLRILRNLIEASGNELRLEKMPALFADVRSIILDGSLKAATFNQAQIADERLKADLLEKHPELQQTMFQLEDHALLHGCLAAFELDANVFEQRALAFRQLFADATHLPVLTGALLCLGDYSSQINQRMAQLGSGSNAARWRDLLTRGGRTQLDRTRQILGCLLDRVATSGGNPQHVFEDIRKEWQQSLVRATGLDWRWYFVKYAAMREGRSGIYVGLNGADSYTVCMLEGDRMNGWYRDAYLLAIYREIASKIKVDDYIEDPWFTSYETVPRWMRLKRSGVEIQCANDGFVLKPPSDDHKQAFLNVCRRNGVGDDYIVRVSKIKHEDRYLDAEDRVLIGTFLLCAFIDVAL